MTATISFDRVSNIYDATRRLPPGISEQITDFIINLVSPTAKTKFYETGIGTGRIAVAIAKRGYCYTRVDISEKIATLRLFRRMALIKALSYAE